MNSCAALNWCILVNICRNNFPPTFFWTSVRWLIYCEFVSIQILEPITFIDCSFFSFLFLTVVGSDRKNLLSLCSCLKKLYCMLCRPKTNQDILEVKSFIGRWGGRESLRRRLKPEKIRVCRMGTFFNWDYWENFHLLWHWVKFCYQIFNVVRTNWLFWNEFFQLSLFLVLITYLKQ